MNAPDAETVGDGSGAAVEFDARRSGILLDDLDDPVALGETAGVFVVVAWRDGPGEAFVVERRRPGGQDGSGRLLGSGQRPEADNPGAALHAPQFLGIQGHQGVCHYAACLAGAVHQRKRGLPPG